jgi:catechol 2,3-dioxygenase-like lactoylglutathione lyase family enzyme
MAQIVNSRCVLAVRDLEVSTRYYTDVLGFRKDPINAEGWSFLTRDSFRVMLGPFVDERPPGELGNHSYFAYWNVEAWMTCTGNLWRKGALVSSKPTNKPWGLKRVRSETGRTQNCVW